MKSNPAVSGHEKTPADALTQPTGVTPAITQHENEKGASQNTFNKSKNTSNAAELSPLAGHELDIATAPHKNSRRWTQGTTTWGEIISWMENPATVKECGNYFLGRLDGAARSKATVVDRCALTLDADHPEPGFLNRLATALAGHAYLWHTTYSATGDKPRYRVIIPLAQPVGSETFAELSQVLMRRVQVGKEFDSSCAEAWRYMFRPAVRDNERFAWEVAHGALMDAAATLATVPDTATALAELDALLGIDEGPTAEPAAFDALPEARKQLARDRVSRTVTALRNKLVEAQDWPEGVREERPGQDDRGWDVLVRDTAFALAGLAKQPWAPLTLEEASRKLRDIVPAEIARDVDLGTKWRSAAAKTVQPWPAPWEEGETSALDDFADPVDNRGEKSLDPDPLNREAEAAFWESRAVLRTVRDFADARMVGRWALLGATLARAAAEVEPTTVIPPIRGGAASLNLFVALCGESGGGKSEAITVSGEVLATSDGALPLVTSLGSGEGILTAYGHAAAPPKGEPNKRPVFVQDRLSVLFDVDEVGALGALSTRTNSTLLPTLKSAWSARTLGNQNADPSRVRRLDAHAYRLALIVGVQPELSGAIFDDAGGGFPQRFLWLPTYHRDRGAMGAPEVPSPHAWTPPNDDFIREDGQWLEVGMPSEAVAAVRAAAAAENRPIGSMASSVALDGHAVLSRMKVAALLALLDGRTSATGQDWQLSETIMAVSDHTRAGVQAVLTRKAGVEADRRAARAGRSEAIASETRDETTVVRVLGRVRKILEESEAVPEGKLRKRFSRDPREAVPEALERLVESGEVIAEEREVKGSQTVFYRLAGQGVKKG